MRLLWLVFQMRMKRQLAYRTAAYAGIVTQVVFGLVLVAIFAAFYANGIKSKHFGIRIMGAYTNASGTPLFGVNINIQTASLLSSISFSGTALITKVGSIG